MKNENTSYTCNRMVSEAVIHQYIDELSAGDATHEKEFYELCGILFGANYKYYRYRNNAAEVLTAYEELFQETMFRVWSGIKNYNRKYPFAYWFYMVSRRVCSRAFEKAGEKPVCISMYTPAGSEEGDGMLLDILAAEERSGDTMETLLVEDILKAMPENYRNAVFLKYVQGCTTKEAAERLHTSESACNNWIHRGTEKFKTLYEEENGYDRD